MQGEVVHGQFDPFVNPGVVENKMVVWHRSMIGLYVMFNNQGQYYSLDRTSALQHCHLWELNPHRGDSLFLDAKLANH